MDDTGIGFLQIKWCREHRDPTVLQTGMAYNESHKHSTKSERRANLIYQTELLGCPRKIVNG